MAEAADVPQLLEGAARTTPRDYSGGGMPLPGDGFTPQRVAVGISAEKLREGVSTFDSAGSITQPNVPGALPAPPRETITLRIVDVPPARMPPDATYDARFVPGESSLIGVPMPGLQPGEGRSGDRPLPRDP
jgi:hypothetical protein